MSGGSRRSGPPPKEIRETSDFEPGYRPSRWELRDLLLALVIVSGAVTVLFERAALTLLVKAGTLTPLLGGMFLVSLVTVGLGVVVHEYAHKFVAIRLERAAAFRAHYALLALSLVTALGGFLFLAPGGVHHRPGISTADEGRIALAGPLSNVALGFLFVPVFLLLGNFNPFTPAESPLLWAYARVFFDRVGVIGVLANFVLAGFNTLPVYPLDGGHVYVWDRLVYVATAVPCILLGGGAVVFALVAS